MKKLLPIILLAVTGCYGEQHYTNTLQRHGFTDFKVGAYSFLGCGENQQGRNFSGTTVTGNKVTGLVCCTPGFGCAVRIRE